MTQRTCIIGAGLAGLACALGAALRGLHVQVLDQAPAALPVPAHIEIVPSMMRDLAALGVADECVRTGFAYHGIDVVDRHGCHLHELPTPNLAGPPWPAALGMRYDDLKAVLQGAGLRHGVQMQLGSRAVAVRQDGPVARVMLDNGTEREADWVLLATGAASALRHDLFPRAAPAATLRQTWSYTLLPRPQGLDRPLLAFAAAGRRAVLVPARNDQAGVAVTHAAAPRPEAARPESFRQALDDFGPRLRGLAQLVHADTRIALRPVRSGLLPSPWHHGRVLAVGDCAHALPPHLGQSAAQSVEDARVISDLLALGARPPSLFSAFEQRRAARVREVHEITTTAARWHLQPDADVDLGRLLQRLTRVVAEPA